MSHCMLHTNYALYMPAFLGGASYVTVHVAVYAVFAVSLITQAWSHIVSIVRLYSGAAIVAAIYGACIRVLCRLLQICSSAI